MVAAAAVGAYVLVVPVAVAIVATHRPREAAAGSTSAALPER